jgi:hypothetical protein
MMSRVAAHAAVAGGAVPSFSRQTGLACRACHYQFLSLTPFGRQFKLNGYTMTAQQVLRDADPKYKSTLALSPIPLLAVMVQTSVTHVKETVPGTQNDNALLPDQLSLFLAGGITPKIGMFTQVTYSGADGSFGIDNMELRFADKTKGAIEAVYGVSLNNNPTMSDLWNTTPVWAWPYASSATAPGGIASQLIDGGLGQRSLGLTGYTMIKKTLYLETGVYRTALQGLARPDITANGVINGVAPYWRVALQHEWESGNIMVGTFGLRARLFPSGITGPTDAFTDIGLDSQWEQRLGTGTLVTRGSWIRERQTLDASYAAGRTANPQNTLKVFKLNSSYYPNQWLGLTLGYFQTSGTADSLAYAPGDVTGSANASPKTNGFIGELDVNPWQNTRLGLQYVAYDKFNGAKANYDGAGRNASGNNTLYLLAWLLF